MLVPNAVPDGNAAAQLDPPGAAAVIVTDEVCASRSPPSNTWTLRLSVAPESSATTLVVTVSTRCAERVNSELCEVDDARRSSSVDDDLTRGPGGSWPYLDRGQDRSLRPRPG